MTAAVRILVVAALGGLLAVPVHAGWREDVAELKAGPFSPPPDGLTVRYTFGWEGISAAGADVRLGRGADGVWTGVVRGGTTGAARALWRLDADYDTKLAADGWRSLGATLTEKYRRYRVEEKMEFPVGGVRSWRESTRKGSSAPQWKNFYITGIRDMAGALLLARSQPLKNGDRLSLAVFPGDWMYLVRVKVEGREKLRWRGEQRSVIRLSLAIDRINDDYSLSPHKKFQSGTIWVSDDEVRMPLRIEVKVFVGSVFAELVEVNTPRLPGVRVSSE
ncbi:MAG: DUF3108 domain-containing protein [Chthoniobacterales bacterium]